MVELGIYILSWNRPHLLVQTVESLLEQLDVPADLHIIDNGSSSDTIEAIKKLPGQKILFGHNLNIAGAYERAVPNQIDRHYPYILTSDHDIYYKEPVSTYLEMLEQNPNCWLAKGHNKPEKFPAHRIERFRGREWWVKPKCAAGTAFMKTADWESIRPFYQGRKYDWKLITSRPPEKYIYVLPGTSLHIGWQKGDSTWQPHSEVKGDQYVSAS